MPYWIFLGISLVELGFEVAISRRNSAALIRKGAREIAPRILPAMTAIYVFMYPASAAEFYFLRTPVSVSWFLGFLALYIAAKALKFWAIKSLGEFWTMKVLVVPGSTVVTRGPYRYVRHPNYIAVLAEIVATTMAGRCWITCVSILVLFSTVLYYRIRSEEDALAGHTDYSSSMAARGRFLP